MKIAVPMLYLYKFSVLENFVSYLRNNYNNYNKATTLSELSELSERFKCSECQLKLVATETGIEHDDLQQPFRGGTPSIALCDFIFQTFSIIDIISPTIKTITENVYVQSVSETALLNPGYITNFITENKVKNLPPGL